MGLKADLESWCYNVFVSNWETRKGTKVPDDESKLSLLNEAIEIEGTVLYADMADSTALVDGHRAPQAAEIYKTFLHCAARIIQKNGGTISAYDGDRVMAVFLGESKNSDAARTALDLRWAIDEIVTPQRNRVYTSAPYTLKHVVGIDTSSLFVAKTGVRGANDLVWVGRAANHAAKLSALTDGYTYITKAVFDRLTQDMLVGSNGGQIWTPIRWDFNGATIYRSTWRRSIS
jgi:class 3 adenylate cyclase